MVAIGGAGHGDLLRAVAMLPGRQLTGRHRLGNTTMGDFGGEQFAQLLPALGAKAGFDPAKVDVVNMAPNLQEQLLLQDQVEAIAIFTATSYMNLVALNLDPDKDFRWIYYADAGADLYSNCIIVSQKLAKEKPEAVKGLVRDAITTGTEVIVLNAVCTSLVGTMDRCACSAQWWLRSV